MKFNIVGVLEINNAFVFNMQTYFVPRQNEELEISGSILVVKYVRYKLQNKNFDVQNVELGLAFKL